MILETLTISMIHEELWMVNQPFNYQLSIGQETSLRFWVELLNHINRSKVQRTSRTQTVDKAKLLYRTKVH